MNARRSRPPHWSDAMNRLFILAAAWVACLLSGAAAAANAEGTLDKIRQSGEITLGYRETSMPFSYVDSKGQVVGYSHEIMMKVVDAIRRELRMPGLRINLVAITSQNRIPLVQKGAIDLECGSTTNNTERQKLVAFSNSLFVIGTRLMTHRESAIRDFKDLAGKVVVTNASSTSEQLLHKLNEEHKLGMKIVTVVDHGLDPLAVLQSGQAQAYMMDDAILYAVISEAWRPHEWLVTGTPQSYEAYGCMMRKGDTAFKKLVDDTIAKIMTSGQIEAIYRKWFLSPIPPKGISLNFPMSEAVARLYKNPNDKAFD